METNQIIRVLDSYKRQQQVQADLSFEQWCKRIVRTAGNQTDLHSHKESWLKRELKTVDEKFSISLTNRINRLGKEFENIVTIVPNNEKDMHEKVTGSNGTKFETHILHTHSYNMKIEDKLGVEGVEPVLVTCRKGAQLVQEVLTNPKLLVLRDSIITTLHHEKAHFFKSREVPWTAEVHGKTRSYTLLPDRSEIRAQLYGMSKSQDPIGSIASLLAMSFHLNYDGSIREFLELQLRHWSEPTINQHSAADLFDFSFPLADHAKEEVIKATRNRLKLLRKYSGVVAVDSPELVAFKMRHKGFTRYISPRTRRP